jgi:MFS family permease
VAGATYPEQVSAAVSSASELRGVLRRRDFRRLYATRLSSQASDGIFQVGLASLFLFSPERATGAGGVAAAFTVLLLPYSLVGPFAGVFLDRWRRRQVLVWANVGRAAMVLGVAGLILAGVTGVLLYAAVLACLSVNRFYLAGLSAALPHVVPREDLVMANSVSTTSGSIAAIAGGGLGVALKAMFGVGDAGDARVIVCAAGVYLLAGALAARMDRDLLGPDLETSSAATRRALRHVAVGLVDGARHVWMHRPAGHALAAITAHRFCYGLMTIAAILLYRNHFYGAGEEDLAIRGLAVVFGASGLGFFVAAVITPSVTRRLSKPRWIVLCLAAAALVELVYVRWLTVPLAVGGAFLIGVGAQGVKICVDTIVQESTDDAYRGRVFTFYDVLFNLSFVAAAVCAAVVLPSDGAAPVVYALLALGYAAAAVLYGRASRPYAGTVGPLPRAGALPGVPSPPVPTP